MRFLGVTALAVFVFASLLTSPASAVLDTDGATVLIRPNGLPGDAHFRPDATSYYVRITVFEKTAGLWGQTVHNGTLHILVPDEAGAWVETATLNFTSAAVGAVVVRIPNEAMDRIDGAPYTLVRAIAELDDGRTSEHSAVKNEAILMGDYDLADSLDSHGIPGIVT